MRVGFLVTGRLKSSRLPKKVILEVAGKPLFSHMCDRLKRARQIDGIVLCTSTNPQDDLLVDIAWTEGVSCYRGSEDDVLMRLCEAALLYGFDYIVNITADCPLVDPLIIDIIADACKKTNADLIQITSLPAGQGPNGVKVSGLKKVCEMKTESETEVWGDYFTKSNIFQYRDLSVDAKYIWPGLKTSIDYPEDYEFIKQLFDELYLPGEIFSLADIVSLVKEKPALLEINSHCIELGRQHIIRTAKLPSFKKN